MADALSLYWWSPLRDARVAAWELRRNHTAWTSMTLRGGMPLQNFGDTLSRRVVREVTGRRVRWARPEAASDWLAARDPSSQDETTHAPSYGPLTRVILRSRTLVNPRAVGRGAA